MAKKKEINIDLGYKVSKINTTKFSFKDLDEDNVNQLFENEDNLSVDLGVGLGVIAEKNEIFFEINTSLTNKKTKENIIQHTGKTTFSIQNLESTYRKESDNFDIPDGLIVQLYALSFSHSRALLAVELNRTVFKDKFHLPVVDPTNILKK